MARSEDGGILIDGKQASSTLQCRHCGRHWDVRPGSGVTRGWCRRCSGPLCGSWDCVAECVPQEARLEHAEGGRSRYTDTIRELVSKGAVLLALVLFAPLAVRAQNPKTAIYPGGIAGDKDLGVQVNHIQTTLAANVSSVATSVAVASCAGFLNYNYVAIGSEIAMLCACTAGTVSFGKSSCPNVDGRGLDGTSAASHTSGDSMFVYIVAGNHNQLSAEVQAIETNLPNPTALRTHECIVTFGDPGAASSALAVDNNAPSVCGNDLGTAWTIKTVACLNNTGTTSVNPILTGGSATSILSAPLTCGNGVWAAGTINGTPTVNSFSGTGATCAATPCTVDANLNAVDGVTKYLVLKFKGTY